MNFIVLVILALVVLSITYGVFAAIMGLTFADIKAGHYFSKPPSDDGIPEKEE